jgi:hypothetical protein
MQNNWIPFITETGLKAKYKIIGKDLTNDVKIKIVTSISKGYYYSALNEACNFYDEFILPTIQIN